MTPAAPIERPPLDAVVLDAAALVEPADTTGAPETRVPGDEAGRARPGARRVLSALRRNGIAVRLVAPPSGGPDAVRAWLESAGLPAAHVDIDTDTAVTDRVLVVGDDEGRPVHRATFRALSRHAGAFTAASLLWAPLDDRAQRQAEQHHLRLTKPPGSLGRLEALGAQLAGIAGTMPPPLPRPAAVAVFAGDHGVHRQGVSPWPQEVTAQMVANFLAGGAAINVLARQVGARVVVVDVGVAHGLPNAPGPGGLPSGSPALLARKVRAATSDLSVGPAMTVAEARRALDVGAEVAAQLIDDGAACLVTGDMGIANTTPAAALIAALTGQPASAVTGRGTGIDDELLSHKSNLVAAAAGRARRLHGDDNLAILAEVGGLEHAALAGFVAGAAALQVPVVVDGVIAASALLVASRLVPGVEQGAIAGHRSVEPGASAVLGELGLPPMIDLGLRLGEGTGAALALPLVEAAARVLAEMATFDQAGVTEK
jgi:nicotinate-nucleotide--dimethylbenzimidazole phosphoribosyltransferase